MTHEEDCSALALTYVFHLAYRFLLELRNVGLVSLLFTHVFKLNCYVISHVCIVFSILLLLRVYVRRYAHTYTHGKLGDKSTKKSHICKHMREKMQNILILLRKTRFLG